jgi:hypothetical protein
METKGVGWTMQGAVLPGVPLPAFFVFFSFLVFCLLFYV